MEEEVKDMAMVDENNIVVNICVVNINNPYCPEGYKLVDFIPNQLCQIGFSYDGQNFRNQEGNIIQYENSNN